MVEQAKRPQAAGLKWRKRKHGPDVPVWFADEKSVAAGYPVKYVNLKGFEGDRLVARAQRLQAEMLRWLSGNRVQAARHDGTFRGLLEVYQTDVRSPFKTKIKARTARTYTTYISKLIAHIGDLRIDHADGRDVMEWFDKWRLVEEEPEADRLGAARMALSVLKAAVSFGIACRAPGCVEFKLVLGELEFDTLAPRSFAPTAEQIVAVRAAAHAHGAPLRALAYAIQFETTLRQWDVIGQWLPLSDKKPSALISGGWKWVGPTWAAIDKNLIMAKIVPTKTEGTTGAEVSFDLSACPMVCEELAKIPEDQREGPLIKNPNTGMPYMEQAWRNGWRKDAEAAGLPTKMWNRDIRAGSVTEGGRAGASKDDRRKIAGHSNEKTTEIYDRDMLEAHRRTMTARKAFRDKNGS